MTKRRESLVSDPNQMSLLELLQQVHEERSATQPGKHNISARFNASAREALRKAPKSRETIADEMTAMLGETITVTMINNWTAESHPHRMPAEVIHVFCIATGTSEPISILAEAAGVFTVNGPDALRADIRKEEEALKVQQRQIRKKVALLEALEAKR